MLRSGLPSSLHYQAILLVLGVCGLGCERAMPSQGRQLKLVARKAYQVPAGFDLAGAAFVTNGVVAWSYSRPELLLFRGQDVTRIHYPANEPPLAVVADQATRSVRILSGLRGRQVLLGDDGRILGDGEVAFKRDEYLARSAVWAANQWIVAARDTLGNEHFLCVSDSGQPREMLTLTRDSLGVRRADSLIEFRSGMLTDRGTLFILGRLPPFRLWRISNVCTEDSRVARIAQLMPSGSSQNDSVPSEYSLPPVILGGGVLLLTIANVKTDHRRIAITDLDGRLLRWRSMAAPMALISGSATGDHILAARRSDRLELVDYEVE